MTAEYAFDSLSADRESRGHLEVGPKAAIPELQLLASCSHLERRECQATSGTDPLGGPNQVVSASSSPG